MNLRAFLQRTNFLKTSKPQSSQKRNLGWSQPTKVGLSRLSCRLFLKKRVEWTQNAQIGSPTVCQFPTVLGVTTSKPLTQTTTIHGISTIRNSRTNSQWTINLRGGFSCSILTFWGILRSMRKLIEFAITRKMNLSSCTRNLRFHLQARKDSWS